MSLLLEMFTYPFILRAFIVGILVSLCAALLGVPLVLKRYSMIGDGLSHVSFGALAVAVACGWAPLPVSIPVVIVAALLFGFFRALGNVYTGFAFLKVMNLPSSVYNMLPYIISLIVLAFTSKNSRAPKAEGIPYDKGQR